MPEIVLIAALAERSRVIGRGLDLPWHLPGDLRRFKAITTGEVLVMGRRTFESLVHQMSARGPVGADGPLPGRRIVVVSRRGALAGHPAVEVYAAIDAALGALGGVPRVFIGGGGEVYAQTLARADRLELTLVAGEHEGDVFFPPYEHLVGPVFTETWSEAHAAEPARGERLARPAYRFATYRRVGA